MRDSNIIITPFHLLSLLNLQITKGVNMHASALFEGIIPEEKAEEYVQSSFKNVQAAILGRDEAGNEVVLFQGIVKSFQTTTHNDLKVACGHLISESWRMDIKPHIRTFQNTGLTYNQVFDSYLKNYKSGNCIMTVGKGQSIQKWLLQYQETDWEFTKRQASRFNSFVVAEYRIAGVKFFFGMPNRPASHTVNPTHYSVKLNVEEYIRKKNNGVEGLTEKDAACYEFTDREIYDVADPVSLHGKPLYVFEIHSTLEGGELVHHYYLKTQNGFKTVKQYNEKIIGASLAANITSISKDMVQVSVKEDENRQNSGAVWIPYSTVYSSPDGTGFYAMPEKGDEVRLYCPNEKEHVAYAISAVHLTASGARDNPDYKSIKNKYGKEVLFTPGSVLVTNNKGMSVELLDDEGIKITSDKAVSIKTTENMDIASETSSISLVAPQSISLEQGDSKIRLENDVIVEGAQTKMQ
ncbi:phage baseplate assembly protein V [Lacrimispora amygdalina]|nr:phage baseplate assembly protein V [Clostridium indicum]